MVTDTSNWVGLSLNEGRYRVVRKLGEGGMAYVYVARDDKLERDVVIKAPRASLIVDPAFAGRFNREVRSLAKLAHAHIVPLIDIGEHEGFPYAVLKFLTGGSLRDRQPRDADGQLLPMQATSLGAWLPAVAQALDFIHKTKFIHRDIKPENILFDEEGQVFLSDLGVVKALADQDTKAQTVYTGAGMVLGTPHYMSPELILGEAADGRADQYALAVTVFEVLTGRFPFSGGSAAAVFVQHTTKPAPSLRTILPSAPAGLADALSRAMAKAPTDRFKSCTEFAQAVLVGGGLAIATPFSSLSENHSGPVTVATLLEPAVPPMRVETPSDLRTVTSPNRKPPKSVKPTRRKTAASRPAPEPTATSGVKTVLLIVLAAVILSAGLAAGYFVMRPATGMRLEPIAPVSLTAGTRGAVGVTIDRRGETDEVTCWIEGLPQDVSLKTVTLAGGETKGTIDLTAPKTYAGKKLTATVNAKSRKTSVSTPIEVAFRDGGSEGPRLLPIDAVSLKAGESANIPIHIDRGTYKGPVSLSVVGLPKGVVWQKANVDTGTVPPEQSMYPLVLKAEPFAAAFDGKLKVSGTIEGSSAIEEKISLTVVAANSPDTNPGGKKQPQPAAGTIRLAPLLDRKVTAGSSVAVGIQVTRSNFAGPIIVTVSGLPSGVTMSPPSPVTIPPGENVALVNFVVDAKAPTGTSNATITARAGQIYDTAMFSFSVTAKAVASDPAAGRKILWERSGELFPNAPTMRYDIGYLNRGTPYTIDLVSSDFDAVLRVELKGKVIASDDNSGGGTNARITLTPPANDLDYELVVTSSQPITPSRGRFNVKIR